MSKAESMGWGDTIDHGDIRMLDEDRNQRSEQAKRFRQAMTVMRRGLEDALRQRERNAREHGDWRKDMDLRKSNLETFMDAESGKTNRAVAREVKYAGEIKQHAARKILKLLLTVRAQAETTYAFVLSWRYFRAFRLGLCLKKSFHMRNRQILRNRLRICARLRYLWRGMHIYHELRIQWVLWHRWLRMLENHYMYQTPGLKVAVKVRTERAQRFSKLLERRGVARDTAYDFDELHPISTDLRACLYRWSLFVSDQVRDRAVRYLLAWRRRLVVLKRFFDLFALGSVGKGAAAAAAKAQWRGQQHSPRQRHWSWCRRWQVGEAGAGKQEPWSWQRQRWQCRVRRPGR